MQAGELIRKFGIPSDTIGGFKSKPFIEMPYGFIRIFLPKLIVSDELDAAEQVMRQTHPEFDINTAIGNEIAAFLHWVGLEMQQIAKREDVYLSSEPDMEFMAAGAHRLDEFGAYAIVDSLAKGDILKHKEIMDMPYYEVYQKLKLDKANREIEKAYHKIIADKAKRK